MNPLENSPQIEDISPEIDQKLTQEIPTKFRENLFLHENLTKTTPPSKLNSTAENQMISSKLFFFPTPRNDPPSPFPKISNNFLLASLNRSTYRASFMHSQGDYSNKVDFPQEKTEKRTLEQHKSFEKLKRKSIFNIISDIYLCRRFINTLLNLTALRKIKWLNDHHFELLNDKSFFHREYQQNERRAGFQRKNTLKNAWLGLKLGIVTFLTQNKLVVFLKTVVNFMDNNKYTKIYDPTGFFTIFWDFLIMLIILYFFITIPLEFSFYAEFPEIPLPMNFRKIALYFLLIDMAKSLNTAFYNKGTLVTIRKLVISNYLKGSFVVDFITIFPLLANFYWGKKNEQFAFFNVLFFFKYFHFMRIRKRLEEFAIFDENLLALVKLVFRIVLFSHVFACFWYFIGTVSENSWLALANLEREDWISHYLHSFYFIIVTMNTVGFGDIVPNNNIEVLFVIFFIFVGCGLFAVNINQIGIILANISKNSKEYHKELNLLNQYMIEKNINFELRTKIRKYLQYIWQEENLEQLGKQLTVINKLSDSLKNELLIEANGPFLRDLKLFNLNFSEETLSETVNIMSENRYTPGDLIFSQNDIDHRSLYIIRKGEIELFNENSDSFNPIKKLGPGDIFAETSFFSDRRKPFSARSLDFSNIFVIKQQDFIKILKKNGRDFERFCQIKDNLNLYEDYGDLFLKCASCFDSSHRVRECPLLHYIPKKEIVILKHIYSQDQLRKAWNRKRTIKTMNSFVMKTRINKIAYKFQKEMISSFDAFSEEDSHCTNYPHDNDYVEIKNHDTKEITECEEKYEEEPENSNKKTDEEIKRNSDFEKSSFEILEDVKTHFMSSKNNSFKKTEKNSQKCSFGNECESSYERDLNREISSCSLTNNLNPHMKNVLNNHIKTSEGILEMLIENIKSGKFHEIVDKLNKNNKNNMNERMLEHIIENSVDIDGIKSFDAYYPYDNIEFVLKRVQRKQLLKRKKSRITARNSDFTEKFTKFNEGNIPNIQVKAYENCHSPFQRKFFKNKRNIEKLIQEEQFDRQKFKEQFLENIKKNKKSCNFFNFVSCFFEKKKRNTILKVARKKNTQKK